MSSCSDVLMAAENLAQIIKKDPELKNEEIPIVKISEIITSPQQQDFTPFPPKVKSDFNFEEFIGGKLITIIGIVILVIGLGIGVKYAIDNDLLGPLARIVLAYVAGAILLVIALRLKQKYKAFSAVLLSGGMASLYFTTFVAYSLYGMFGQTAAFGIMVIFTMFTVYAAIIYELQIIGIIGLVGAYAVPMLLSDGSGKIEIMFSYMVILNVGILYLSFKKYWQVINYVAYGFTWLIVATWWLAKYDYETQTPLLMIFSFLFFIIFYISNMSYKIVKHEKFGVMDVIRIVTNSFIFFGIGYDALDHEYTRDYLGAFTVANALIHFIFAYIVFKNKLLDRKLFYLLIALVLSFITIAIPVQLEGNWVTLFWAAEAVLLFSIGRYKAVRFYEWLGYIMISLAIFSLLHDWGTVYSNGYDYEYYKYWIPFLNIHLFTSLFVAAAVGTMIYIHNKKTLSPEDIKKFGINTFIEYAMGIALFCITYCAFSNEISAYYKALYERSMINMPSKDAWAPQGEMIQIYDYSLLKLKDVALGMYSMLFFIIFSLVTLYKITSPQVRWAAFGLNMLVLGGFLTAGLSELSTLNYSLYADTNATYYTVNSILANLRYFCYLLFGGLLFLNSFVFHVSIFRFQRAAGFIDAQGRQGLL